MTIGEFETGAWIIANLALMAALTIHRIRTRRRHRQDHPSAASLRALKRAHQAATTAAAPPDAARHPQPATTGRRSAP